MRAVVTGGAGFIGSNLVDALVARGDDVTVLDNFATGKRELVNPAAHLVEHDIREPFEVEADVIFHLAAQADVQTSMQQPGYDAAVNVVGTANVLAAAKGAQVIFASSGGAGYGECAEPATEETPFLPLSPYGIAKKCGEEYLAGWNRIHGTSHISLRFANVYGPRQDAGLEGGVVAIFLERLARGDETVIYGDGEQCRDFVYVADIVSALVRGDGAKRRAVQRRKWRRHERGRALRRVCCSRRERREAPPGPGAARRRSPFRPRRVADRA